VFSLCHPLVVRVQLELLSVKDDACEEQPRNGRIEKALVELPRRDVDAGGIESSLPLEVLDSGRCALPLAFPLIDRRGKNLSSFVFELVNQFLSNGRLVHVSPSQFVVVSA
jgi:hypothetical protein